MKKVKSTSIIPSRSLFCSNLLFPYEDFLQKSYSEIFSDKNILDTIYNSSGYPKIDIIEEEKEFIINAAIPGTTEENIQIEITPENILKISGQSEEKVSKNENNYVLKEIKSSKFIREIFLPDNLEGEPKAVLKNGILNLKWNKKKKEEVKEQNKKIIVTKD